MKLCSEGHDEVCYEERFCPVCTLLNKIHEIDELEEEQAKCEAEAREIEEESRLREREKDRGGSSNPYEN